MVATSIFLSAL